MSKPKKATILALSRQIEQCKNNIAKERDKLRELMDDVAAVEYDCEEAVTELENAIDCLSKYL